MKDPNSRKLLTAFCTTSRIELFFLNCFIHDFFQKPENEDEEKETDAAPVESEKSVNPEEKNILIAPSEIKLETSPATLEPYNPNVPVGKMPLCFYLIYKARTNMFSLLHSLLREAIKHLKTNVRLNIIGEFGENYYKQSVLFLPTIILFFVVL